ncbi:hypothetical protein Anas_05437 [Armadillidium nasatum]|uniref:Uncharacterized protein n=1 Tax=Armadillidium nasatum TaxID=96803 RepID=A0A5N5SI39_9CRUS|nr:hypothetical protein Anas_05437 [Armadillidium nasatum]
MKNSNLRILLTQSFEILFKNERLVLYGGKLFYFEHILEHDDAHWLRRILQHFLTVTGIWPLFFDGCHLNREVLRDLQAAGFSKVNGKKKHIDIGRPPKRKPKAGEFLTSTRPLGRCR